ncbi:MAG: transglutaminase domain-containing protein, partial [bacterium]
QESKLNDKKKEIEKLDEKLREEFKETEEFLKEKKLPEKILQRHNDFVKQYNENYKKLQERIENAKKGKIKPLMEFLEKAQYKEKPIRQDKPSFRIKRIKETKEERPKATSSKSVSLLQVKPLSNQYLQESPPEIKFTQEIKELTNSLDKSPLKIYQYVRNNIKYEPYYGSQKGAIGCLHEQAGNDLDQASLLISLLRASNIQARYVYGKVEIPIERAKLWLGINDPWKVADILYSYGIPAITLVRGGKPYAIKIEHFWVESYIDYIPSGGAIHKQGDTWIPLDPSFKLQKIEEGEDISDEVIFDKESFLSKQQEIEIPLYFWLNQLGTYAETNFPKKRLYEFSRRKAIIPEEIEVLPASLPYEIIEQPTIYSKIPDNLRYKIGISLSSEDILGLDLFYQIPLPELGESRLTLSYKSDLSLYNNPAYLVELQPVIKIDGQEKAVGDPIGAGKDQTITIDLFMPNQETDCIQNTIIAGEFHNLCITWPFFSSQLATEIGQRLITNIEGTGPDFLQNGFFSEDIAGDYLFMQGKSYFGQVGIMDEIASSFLHLPFFKDILFAHLFVEADVDYLFGMPYTMKIRGLSIDADRNICAVIGASDKIKEFMTISGYTSSVLEHNIWEKWYGEGAISAIKAIQIAGEHGISVYDIDSSNVGIVDGFNIPSFAKQDIKNAINAGNIAKCPQSSITYNGWQGIGYIIQDPTTGEGRYEIAGVSGGLFLLTHPSAKSWRYYYDIEKRAIEYAKTLTGDDCTKFANFAQFLANQFTENEFKQSFFLHALYDLSVSDEWQKWYYDWYLALLGNGGPRKSRPAWLNNHNDGGEGSGFKVFFPEDPDRTGRKDHFVVNAACRELGYIVWMLYEIFKTEESLNDLKYNAEGMAFGIMIIEGEISRFGVEGWIMEYLHE